MPSPNLSAASSSFLFFSVPALGSVCTACDESMEEEDEEEEEEEEEEGEDAEWLRNEYIE